MKFAIRTLVALIVVAGITAAPQSSSITSRNKVTTARTSMLPVPICAPNDPNACGMGTR